MKKRLAFIDVDGAHYFRAENGDFVLKDGSLVDLNTESHLRDLLKDKCPWCGASKRARSAIPVG